MFHIVKLIVWIAGLAVIAYFALPYFGYEVNLNYLNESKAKCQESVNNCTKELVEQGTKNAKCDFSCVDPLIIKKKQ